MSAKSPIVSKPVNNIFGNQSGELQSAIKMKRKNRINNINDKNNDNMKSISDDNVNNVDNVNNIINSTIYDTRDKTDDTPDDYYHRHRDRKLEYQKSYNRENDEKIKEYNKDYYLKRRAEILEKAKTRVTCECGCDVQLSNMNAHKKTKKHLKRAGCVTHVGTD
jgi:ElaB/YqjD/DUF883 family membrane-anchored ribosome-binding protein